MTTEEFARPQYLVETAWVAAHLADPALRVFDCTIILAPTQGDPFRIESVAPDRALALLARGR